MSFSNRVQGKIAERQAGVLSRALAERDARLRQHFAPLIAAVEAMRDRLHDDKLFADVMGRPELTLEPWNDNTEDGCNLQLRGRLAIFSVSGSMSPDILRFRIQPDFKMAEAIKCSSLSYSPFDGIRGHLANLPAFLIAIEDHMADFLADVATSPAAHTLLSTPPVATRGFGV